MTQVVIDGMKLFMMLNDIIEGKRKFDGIHGVETKDTLFIELYNNTYHNYFCSDGNGGFILVLHPDVKSCAEALNMPRVMEYCSFERNSDSIQGITAANVAQLYEERRPR